MKISNVRVSKQEQHKTLQIDALKEAGGEERLLDKIAGSKAERKGLDEPCWCIVCIVARSIFHKTRLMLFVDVPLAAPILRLKNMKV